MKEGYIKRATSTIPFGYELDDETSSFLKPIEDELEALQVAENMVVNEEISLQAACDWLEYKTDRRMSAPGLKKHIDKKYGETIKEAFDDKIKNIINRGNLAASVCLLKIQLAISNNGINQTVLPNFNVAAT